MWTYSTDLELVTHFKKFGILSILFMDEKPQKDITARLGFADVAYPGAPYMRRVRWGIACINACGWGIRREKKKVELLETPI